MARDTGPIAKQSRRERTVLHANRKSARALEKRPYPPGEHGRGRIRESEYLLQLREKQKARRIYGVLEKQFVNYYKKANARPGRTGENLLIALETRLDNALYRGGLARTRQEARQMVNHRHVQVNGRTVDIPSYALSPSDIITIRERSRDMVPVLGAIELLGSHYMPGWVSLDVEHRRITILDRPRRDQIDVPVNEQLIVELYSK
jgi:small subunit ribosomal protein S4